MRAAVWFGIAILSTASWNSPAEARGGGGRGGGGWSGRGSLVSVGGYTRRDGTYVAPHYRTKPDGIPSNNLTYRGGGSYGYGSTTSSYTYQGSVPVVSAIPMDAPVATVASLLPPAAPRVKMPWCSDGTIISGFCVLN